VKTHKYFITGLPRSGTAWLANFLTWDNSFCHHEGIYGCNDMDQFEAKMDGSDIEYVGDSDTALLLLLPALYRKFPDAKYIFIRRNPEDAHQSLLNGGAVSGHMDESVRCFNWGIRNIPSLVMDFDRVFEDVEAIWDYIGLPDFPQKRAELLQYMKMDELDHLLNRSLIDFSGLMREVA